MEKLRYKKTISNRFWVILLCRYLKPDIMKNRYISFHAVYIFSFACIYTSDVMKRRLLIGGRTRGHQRSRDQQLTQRSDTTKVN